MYDQLFDNMSPFAIEQEVGMMKGFFVVLIIVYLWLIAAYIIRSLSLFKLGKALGTEAYGLAWVPAAYTWVLGGVADKYDSKNGKDHKFRMVLICLTGAMAVLLAAFFAVYIFIVVGFILGGFMHGPGVDSTRAVLWVLIVIYVPLLLVAMGSQACKYICYYKLFELCKPEKPLMNFLIAIMVPFALPFVILSAANTYVKKVEEEKALAVQKAEEAAETLLQ